MVAMNTALTAIARRSARVRLGVSEASRTAVSIGPMTAKKVVKAVSAVSSMVFAGDRLGPHYTEMNPETRGRAIVAAGEL